MSLKHFFLVLTIAGAAQASALFTSPGTGTVRQGQGFSLGAQFVVSAGGLVVTALGFYDVTGNALISDHEIGLWDVSAGNTKIADLTVTAGTTNSGVPGFLYVNLGAPVALTNGHTYRLATYYPTGTGDALLDCCTGGTAPTADARFTSVVGAFTTSNVVGSLSEPNGTAGFPYIGPNLQFDTIPEPGTLGLTITAMTLLLAFAHKRASARRS
jgi:hypothetical protein